MGRADPLTALDTDALACVVGAGYILIKNSIFKDNNLLNTGYTKGGGIDIGRGTLVIIGSLFTNNYGTAGQIL
jgi:hypothetical protein